MATGVPRTKWKGASLPDGLAHPGGRSEVRLAYEGKKTEQEIMRTPPARCDVWWPKAGSAHARSRLYWGENLAVLSALRHDSSVRGQVRLIYIDPPYATKSVFQSRNQTNAYTDLLEGAHYLEFLRERLVLLRELLAEDGSIYVHLDDKMAFLAKAIMDEVFGASNFRNWITRKKCNPKNYTRHSYGNVADYLLFYTKSDDYVWHRPVEAWTEERAKEYQYVEPETGRKFMKVPVHAPGVRHGETGQLWRGRPPPPGKHWQYPPRVLDEMDARGEIYWSPNGNPRRKIYLDQSAGVPVQDLWLDFRDAHNQNIKITGYPTEKNPDLLARIIKASSDEGDLVMDCFAGSGTTLEAASRLKRRWIGIDSSGEAIRATLSRFGRGLEAMGDFVSDRYLHDEGSEDETLPLFDSEPEKPREERQREKHAPITDFALIAAEHFANRKTEILSRWVDLLGSAKVDAVCEAKPVFQIIGQPASARKPKKRKPRGSRRKAMAS
ncbi:MAG: restriction endonuclease subunit M [Opitutus sp.]|nr:restriction endonuclease subunit M [Opitutus sp.]